MKKNKVKEVIKSLVEMVICALVIFCLFTYIVVPVRIEGSSMENTLHDGNVAFINAIGAQNGNVERFDVVVLYSQDLNEKIIKRVIGLPGDHIVYKDDQLYINDQYVKEDFFDQEFIDYSKKQYSVPYFTDDFEATVGENEIFVMGDNRLRSTDSRDLGCFSFNDIIGKQGVVIFPFSDIQWLD